MKKLRELQRLVPNRPQLQQLVYVVLLCQVLEQLDIEAPLRFAVGPRSTTCLHSPRRPIASENAG